MFRQEESIVPVTKHVIDISCPCGTRFTYDHGDTEMGTKLASVFLEKHRSCVSTPRVSFWEKMDSDHWTGLIAGGILIAVVGLIVFGISYYNSLRLQGLDQ